MRHHDQASRFERWAREQGMRVHARWAETGTAYVTLNDEWQFRFGDHGVVYPGTVLSVSPTEAGVREAKHLAERLLGDESFAGEMRRSLREEEREAHVAWRTEVARRIEAEGGLEQIAVQIGNLETRLTCHVNTGEARRGDKGRAKYLRELLDEAVA